jgi:alcohol dehydrogenase
MMRALVLTTTGPRVQDHPEPTPVPGEALLRPLLAGICATDLELCRGYMGFTGVLGHEFVAVVEQADDPTWIGRRVVGEINCPCGACPACRAGRPTHCPTRTVLGIDGRDGCLAARFALPLANLHLVPEPVPDEQAVFAEPLAAACRITEQLHLHPVDRVVVLGAGRLGQLVARVLALTGARLQVVEPDPARRALLPAGVEGVPLDQAPDLAGADVVVECTGHRDGLALASALVRPQGTIVLKTTVADPAAPPVVPWVIHEVTVLGSRCGPFAPALRLLEAGLVDPAPLISEVLPLDRGVEGLERAREAGVLKVLIRP